MDRDVQWLRRRIATSLGTQSAATFGIGFVAIFSLILWQTTIGPAMALLIAALGGQLIAGARVLLALRSNPLSFRYLRRYVSSPSHYRVTPPEETPHEVAEQLHWFDHKSTLRDDLVEPSPIFDIFEDEPGRVAVALSRASGEVSLCSSLADGRILVTDCRLLPPHPRIVMNFVPDCSVPALVARHLAAMLERTDLRPLAPSGAQVVHRLLICEREAYAEVGPLLGPFFEVEPHKPSRGRLTVRVVPEPLSGPVVVPQVTQ